MIYIVSEHYCVSLWAASPLHVWEAGWQATLIQQTRGQEVATSSFQIT